MGKSEEVQVRPEGKVSGNAKFRNPRAQLLEFLCKAGFLANRRHQQERGAGIRIEQGLRGFSSLEFAVKRKPVIFEAAPKVILDERRIFDLKGGAEAIADELRRGNISEHYAIAFLANVNEVLAQQGIAPEEVVR